MPAPVDVVRMSEDVGRRNVEGLVRGRGIRLKVFRANERVDEDEDGDVVDIEGVGERKVEEDAIVFSCSLRLPSSPLFALDLNVLFVISSLVEPAGGAVELFYAVRLRWAMGGWRRRRRRRLRMAQ